MVDQQVQPQSGAISPWALKPWWCQPWSIVLTGIGIIGGSWWLFHTYWITACVTLPIAIWMGFFLVLWPRLMRESGLLEAMYSEIDTEAATRRSGLEE